MKLLITLFMFINLLLGFLPWYKSDGMTVFPVSKVKFLLFGLSSQENQFCLQDSLIPFSSRIVSRVPTHLFHCLISESYMQFRSFRSIKFSVVLVYKCATQPDFHFSNTAYILMVSEKFYNFVRIDWDTYTKKSSFAMSIYCIKFIWLRGEKNFGETTLYFLH